MNHPVSKSQVLGLGNQNVNASEPRKEIKILMTDLIQAIAELEDSLVGVKAACGPAVDIMAFERESSSALESEAKVPVPAVVTSLGTEIFDAIQRLQSARNQLELLRRHLAL